MLGPDTSLDQRKDVRSPELKRHGGASYVKSDTKKSGDDKDKLNNVEPWCVRRSETCADYWGLFSGPVRTSI